MNLKFKLWKLEKLLSQKETYIKSSKNILKLENKISKLIKDLVSRYDNKEFSIVDIQSTEVQLSLLAFSSEVKELLNLNLKYSEKNSNINDGFKSSFADNYPLLKDLQLYLGANMLEDLRNFFKYHQVHLILELLIYLPKILAYSEFIDKVRYTEITDSSIANYKKIEPNLVELLENLMSLKNKSSEMQFISSYDNEEHLEAISKYILNIS